MLDGVIVWAGSGVWTMNWSELGALFLNKWLVCVPGDNMTIFIDVLVARVAPDPLVNGQSLPNSSPVVFHLLAAKPWQLYSWKSPSALQQQSSGSALTERGYKLPAALPESLTLG